MTSLPANSGLLRDSAASLSRVAPPGTSVLVVSADAEAARPSASLLVSAGFRVSVEHDPANALKLLDASPIDLVLVVSGTLRGRSSLEFCAALHRHEPVPIVAVFLQPTTEDDHLAAFAAGVDDCLALSCGPREAIARLTAVLRRARWGPVRRPRTLEVGKLLLDFGAMTARFEGRQLHLTQYEFELLRALAEQAGRVLSREELMERAKGTVDDAFDRSIDVHICRLRAKLGDVRRRPRVLKTVRGVGYLFDPVGSLGTTEEAGEPHPRLAMPA